MSSICAIWKQGDGTSALDLLHLMDRAQTAYGPDKNFAWGDRQIALGGNLLAILQEDRFDRQPVWAADRAVCLVADVSLYNRPELEHDLGLTGTDSMADSEVLLAAWLRWGEDCLNHLIGAFAFAVWIPAEQRIFAARDHVGERPLHYHRGEGLFALATMPKGLLAIPGVFRGFDQERLATDLTQGMPPAGHSYFAGIAALPPGHLLCVTLGSFESRPYWDPTKVKPVRFQSDSDYAEALLELFDRATEGRMRTTRRVGCQLSSGLDSSSVASSVARILAARGERMPVFTSVPRKGFLGKGLPGRLPFEAPGAAEVVAMYPNMDHVLVDSEGGDLLANIKRWADQVDQPAQNAINLVWMGHIFEQAKARDINVLFQGVFGNATISFETFTPFQDLLLSGRWLKLFRLVRRLRALGDTSWRGAANAATQGLVPLWLKSKMTPAIGKFNLDFSPVNPVFAEQNDLRARTFARFFEQPRGLQAERAGMFHRFDFGTLNAGMQAMFGIELRDPTSDRRIFEYCFSIPGEQYVVGDQSRSLVRRAMKDRLPATTLARYKRGQQGVDWYMTMAEALPSLAAELPSIAESKTAREVLDLPRLQRLIDTWPETGHESNDVTMSWNYALSRGVAMGYFLRKFEGPDRPA